MELLYKSPTTDLEKIKAASKYPHFVPASSYVNFLITNNTVFQAKYWTEGKSETLKAKDEKAKEILQHYFPDRKVAQLNPIQMNYKGGGLHCWTMQVPR